MGRFSQTWTSFYPIKTSLIAGARALSCAPLEMHKINAECEAEGIAVLHGTY